MIKKPLLREKLGLTQLEIAQYLGVSESLYNKYERHIRSLPAYASLKLSEMEVLLHKPPAKNKSKPAHLASQQNKMQRLIEKQAAANKYRRIRLQHRLTVIEKKYRQHLLLLQLVTYLLQQAAGSNSKTKKETGSRLALHTLQSKAARGVEKNGLHVQLKLLIEIEGLQPGKEEWIEMAKTLSMSYGPT